ncbi:hypothetical protein KFZ76_15745 [Methylovulum psychrotolerans]|uniref:hypothetical protein n=1 Tax=Methylovulum psychrotolerans TaxID=1704499 RepID=UPI001BFF9FE8|nr:hypothetical protein [Methylovulum psychrotolerans]MBT9099154.1 hypothetical protein [Methylovulum psychrotolerans]
MKPINNDVSHHILPNSATMVGVCIMVISIVKGSMGSGLECYLIDKFLAVDSLVFMVSALLSFSSIRTVRMEANLERWAEILFLLGLVSMTLITLVFAFEIV